MIFMRVLWRKVLRPLWRYGVGVILPAFGVWYAVYLATASEPGLGRGQLVITLGCVLLFTVVWLLSGEASLFDVVTWAAAGMRKAYVEAADEIIKEDAAKHEQAGNVTLVSGDADAGDLSKSDEIPPPDPLDDDAEWHQMHSTPWLRRKRGL